MADPNKLSIRSVVMEAYNTMKKIFLSLFAFVFSASLFAQTAGYQENLAKAKEYEEQGRWVYALASYYDAMEAEPTVKAEEALKAYTKLADVIKSGKPGYGDNMDEFDIYDGWMAICTDLESLWQEKSPFYFKSGSVTKGALDMETRTGSYDTSLTCNYTAKYNVLNSLLLEGWKKAYRSDWTGCRSDSLKLSDSPSERSYYVKAAIVDQDGKILYELPESKQYKSYWDSEDSFKWTIKGVPRERMKEIDASTCTVKVTGVSWNYNGKKKSHELVNCELVAQGSSPLQNAVALVKSSVQKEEQRAKAAAVLSSIKESMVFVEGGIFQMGRSSGYSSERPVHSVILSSFSIGKTEVTQEQWKAVMGNNPSYYNGDLRPVERVSWYDAIVFCNKLSLLSEKRPVYTVNGKSNPAEWNYIPCQGNSISGSIEMEQSADGYRLPTEAEWEYAARGGKKSRGYKYSGSDNLESVAWYSSNSGDKTHDVATKAANELGLYDMSGNVAEWCWDWYGDYSPASQTNPAGASSGSGHVERGGSYYYDYLCTVSYRGYDYPNFRLSNCGFRVLCPSSEK